MIDVMTTIKDVIGDELESIKDMTHEQIDEMAGQLTQKLVNGGVFPYVNDEMNEIYTQAIRLVLEVALSGTRK